MELGLLYDVQNLTDLVRALKTYTQKCANEFTGAISTEEYASLSQLSILL